MTPEKPPINHIGSFVHASRKIHKRAYVVNWWFVYARAVFHNPWEYIMSLQAIAKVNFVNFVNLVHFVNLVNLVNFG